MKNLLLFLLFFGISQGLVIENLIDKYENVTFKVYEESDRSRSLEGPNIYHITISGPPYKVRVMWHLLPSPPLNPIRGYHVTIWEQRTQIVQIIEEVDGVLQVVGEKEVLVDMPPFNVVPDWTPRELRTLPSTHNFAEFYNIKLDFDYEIRVQGFTWEEVGPYSPMLRVKLCTASCSL